MAIKLTNIPEILIYPKVKAELDYIIEKAYPCEVGGIGKVKVEDRKIIIEKVVIIKQNVSVSHVSFSSADLARFVDELLKKGEDPSSYRCWWHSHPWGANLRNWGDLKEEYSEIDVQAIELWGKQCDFVVSLLGNGRGDYNVRLDIFRPIRLTISGLSLKIAPPPLSEEEKERIEKEIKKKVKSRGWSRGYVTTWDSWGWRK